MNWTWVHDGLPKVSGWYPILRLGREPENWERFYFNTFDNKFHCGENKSDTVIERVDWWIDTKWEDE